MSRKGSAPQIAVRPLTIGAPWAHFLSELVGSALLVSLGLSVVIVNFGTGSPLIAQLPNPGVRRVVTGFLFGLFFHGIFRWKKEE